VLLAGSSARGTFLTNKRDLDIFILFNTKIEESLLEDKLKNILKKAFPGLKLTKNYSQHPYFKAKVFGFDIDFVPGYNIKDIKERKTAVDRTPLHLKYLQNKLNPDIIKDIIIFKKFLYNNLLYGADLRKNGFPGYLVELLILHYGNIYNLFWAIYNWQQYLEINSFKRQVNKFDSSFIVIDPTDEQRNVASAFINDNFLVLKKLINLFLLNPSISFFEKNIYKQYVEIPKLETYEINKKFDLTEDAVWGLAKAKAKKIEKLLRQKSILSKISVFVKKSKIFFFVDYNLGNYILTGPEITDKQNYNIFITKHKETFIKDNRVYVVVKKTQKEKQQTFIEITKSLFEMMPKEVKIEIKGEIAKKIYKDWFVYKYKK